MCMTLHSNVLVTIHNLIIFSVPALLVGSAEIALLSVTITKENDLVMCIVLWTFWQFSRLRSELGQRLHSRHNTNSFGFLTPFVDQLLQLYSLKLRNGITQFYFGFMVNNIKNPTTITVACCERRLYWNDMLGNTFPNHQSILWELHKGLYP